jgi:sugar phosphate isomerase/epimerase
VGDAPYGRRRDAAGHAVISRRGFLGAAIYAPLYGARKLNIGIGTYSYHSLSMDAMLVQLQRLQIREVEMSRGEFMLFSKPTSEQFAAARAKFDAAGIRCVSYYAATIHDNAELETAIHGARLLGSRNITGDATGSILQTIDERCTSEGLTFAIHNHFFKGKKFPYESPDDVLAALNGRSGTMGAALDTGQFASCGYDTVEAVRKLASHLKMVHLKDIEAPGAEVNVLLGKGIARIPDVVAELVRVSYGGLVAIENEKEGPVEEDLRLEVEYARNLVKGG